jgi:hypothetical protein
MMKMVTKKVMTLHRVLFQVKSQRTRRVVGRRQLASRAAHQEFQGFLAFHLVHERVRVLQVLQVLPAPRGGPPTALLPQVDLLVRSGPVIQCRAVPRVMLLTEVNTRKKRKVKRKTMMTLHDHLQRNRV